jgi:hypothetical protein
MAGERKKFCIPCCQKFCMLVAKNSVFLFAKNSVFLFTDHTREFSYKNFFVWKITHNVGGFVQPGFNTECVPP